MTHRQRAIDLLLALLRDGPRTSVEVRAAARAVGIEPSTLYAVEGRVDRVPNAIRRRPQAARDGTSLWWLEPSPVAWNACG